MNCVELKDVLNAFLNGSLSAEEAREVCRHLASCPSCASTLAPADRVEMLPVLDEEVEPSGDFAARFRGRLYEQQSRPQRGYWYKLAAAAAFLILAGGIFLGQYARRSQPMPENLGDLSIAEDLPLLEDMAVIRNLDLLENFDAIEELTIEERGER